MRRIFELDTVIGMLQNIMEGLEEEAEKKLNYYDGISEQK